MLGDSLPDTLGETLLLGDILGETLALFDMDALTLQLGEILLDADGDTDRDTDGDTEGDRLALPLIEGDTDLLSEALTEKLGEIEAD